MGTLDFDGARDVRGIVERMARGLAHRAPDGSRVWSDGGIALGHGLMRVTNEDRFERQPLVEDDVVVTADLRLDNREDLATALDIAAGELAVMADSALLRKAYRAWGDRCVERLLGDFAFAIWDCRERRLLVARDHMGQRNCFFRHGDGRFLFASEIKALWTDPDVPRVLSDSTIAHLLLHDRSIEAARTPQEGIECLGGGEMISVSADGSVRRETYWRPVADPIHVGRDEDYYVQAYRRILGEAVACRVRRAAAPVGLLMSGGYDSAAVAGLAGAVLGNRRMLAVSSVMPEGYSGSVRHARRWVDLCARDMPHLDVRYVVLADGNPLDGAERRFLRQDTKAHAYDFAAESLYAAAAANGARSVLTGYGGEITLNPRANGLLAHLLARGRVFDFVRELRAHTRLTRRTLWSSLKHEVVAKLWPEAVTRWGASRPAVGPPIRRGMAEAGGVAASVPRAFRSRRAFLDRQGIALRHRAASSARTELAYAAGLEQSEPFYDKRVVELGLALPVHLHLRHGRERDLACRALADVYPAEFQQRWRLNDDMLPDFQRMVKAIEPELLASLARMEESGRLADYIDFDAVRQLLAARGPEDHASGWEQETHLALDAYLTARYVEWFRGYN